MRFCVLCLRVHVVVGDNSVRLRGGSPRNKDRILSHYKSFDGTRGLGYYTVRNYFKKFQKKYIDPRKLVTVSYKVI